MELIFDTLAFPAIAYIEQVPKNIQRNDWKAAEQIKKLVDVFLSIRREIMPPITKSSGTGAQESQESQDEYGFLDLNMDDPALLQALGVPELPVDDRRALDGSIAQIMDKTLVPYFYTKICKQVEEDSERTSSQPIQCDFRWVDSWTECIQVVIAHELKVGFPMIERTGKD